MGKTKTLQLLVACVVAATIVVPVAGAAIKHGPKKPAPKPADATKRLVTLRGEAEGLAKRVAALKAADAGLAGRPAAPAPAPIQQSIEAPSGPAGGDLYGAYPAPDIAPHSVSSEALAADSIDTRQLALGTLGNQDFVPGSIGSPDVIDGSVTAAQIKSEAFDSVRLGETFRWPPEIRGPNVSITLAPGQHGRAAVTCPNGTRLISGGFFWKNLQGRGTEILNSSPGSGGALNTWEVVAKVESGGTENTVTPVALCLE